MDVQRVKVMLEMNALEEALHMDLEQRTWHLRLIIIIRRITIIIYDDARVW